MGVPTGGGQNLGQAVGRIRIDTGDVQRAQAEVQSASRAMSTALTAVGISLGAAGAVQLGRFAVEADRVATAYARQSVAALNLAGSQEQLNALLEAYDRATGNAIDKATALSDVTRLQAVGFADNAEELERFVRAARGISVATGQNQDYVISQLQLAIANQSTLRLDQLGLGVSEVAQRIDELRASNSSLTKEMAYQQAILELAENKFGALVDSIEAQATGVEKLRKAWKDFQLEFGQAAGGGLGIIFEGWANDIERARQELQWFSNLLNEVARAGQQLRFDIGISDVSPDARQQAQIGRFERDRFLNLNRQSQLAGGFSDDQTAAIREWSEGVQDIERQAARDRLDATRQFEEQRASTLREYGKTIAREAEDFARNRARAEVDFAKSIEDVRRNSARNEVRQAEDLARNINQAWADSEERIAEVRTDSAKRLAEIDEDYTRNRERAARDHSDSLLEAAGRLDAKAVAEAQRNFRRQEQDAKEAYDEQRDDLAEQLQERIERERTAFDKSTRQQQDAYDRQLEDAREADAQRIEDMEADFALRKEREDEDRGIRLERLAQDHNDQLAEQDRQHALRLQQIAEQEQEERTKLDEEFRIALDELGIRTDAWIAAQTRITDAAIAEFDRWWANLAENLPMMNPGANPVDAAPYMRGALPATPIPYNPVPGWQRSSGGASISGVSFNIYATPNQNPNDIASAVRFEMIRLLEEVG